MKFVVTLVAVFYLLNPTDFVKGSSDVKTKSMKQKVDNFDDNNRDTWEQRYMVNEKHFKQNGPIFIYVGGELPIEEWHIKWTLLVDLAQEFNGILFSPEHRTYGKSKLGKDLSLNTLKFLNAKQALADLANFITTQRKTDSRLANSKVIVSGCSYPGALAVWFSRLYPDLVDGTWSISAPLLAKVDFPEYLEVTGKAIKTLGGAQCYNRIEKGVKELEKMFQGNQAEEATKLLNMCDNFHYTKQEDISAIFREISYYYAQLVTYQKLHKEDIPIACDYLMKRPNDVAAVVEFLQEKFNAKHKEDAKKCINFNYNGIIYHHNLTDYKSQESGMRQWLYQMCNEFGYFQTTTSNKQPFGKSAPLAFDMQQCREIFGPDFTEERIKKNIAETNKVFGGLKPNIKNVYMTYGGLDPWTAVGLGESKISSVVPGYSHCAHLDPISSVDSPEMLNSKKRLFTLVREWLAK